MSFNWFLELLTKFQAHKVVGSSEKLEVIKKLLQNKKMSSMFIRGERYFLFLFKKNIYVVNETSFSLVLSLVAFVSAILAKKIIHYYKLDERVQFVYQKMKKKTHNGLKRPLGFIRNKKHSTLSLIKKVRGGNEEPSLEKYFDAKYPPIGDSTLASDLYSMNQLLIKEIVTKCIRRGRAYRITDNKLSNLISEMIQLKSYEQVKKISHEVLILAITLSTYQPFGAIVYGNANDVIRNFKLGRLFIDNCPIIFGVVIGGITGWRSNINRTTKFNELFTELFKLGSKVTLAARMASFIRSKYIIDCADYFLELEKTPITTIQQDEKGTIIDVTRTEEHYVKDLPAKSDIFAVPNHPKHANEIYHQLDTGVDLNADVSIETLDGLIKTQRSVDGTISVGFKQTASKAQSYKPLKGQVNTWADLYKYDTTEAKESTERIIDSIAKRRYLVDAIQNPVDGE